MRRGGRRQEQEERRPRVRAAGVVAGGGVPAVQRAQAERAAVTSRPGPLPSPGGWGLGAPSGRGVKEGEEEEQA